MLAAFPRKERKASDVCTLIISAKMIAWVRSFDPRSTRGTNGLTKG
jgi:hypothetical protein